jgi:hypothetical protein
VQGLGLGDLTCKQGTEQAQAGMKITSSHSCGRDAAYWRADGGSAYWRQREEESRRARRPEESRRAELRPVRAEGHDGAEATELRWTLARAGSRRGGSGCSGPGYPDARGDAGAEGEEEVAELAVLSVLGGGKEGGGDSQRRGDALWRGKKAMRQCSDKMAWSRRR